MGALTALISILALSPCYSMAQNETAVKAESETKTVQNPKGVGRVYYDLFDTVSYIYSYAGDSEEEFIENFNKYWDAIANGGEE